MTMKRAEAPAEKPSEMPPAAEAPMGRSITEIRNWQRDYEGLRDRLKNGESGETIRRDVDNFDSRSRKLAGSLSTAEVRKAGLSEFSLVQGASNLQMSLAQNEFNRTLTGIGVAKTDEQRTKLKESYEKLAKATERYTRAEGLYAKSVGQTPDNSANVNLAEARISYIFSAGVSEESRSRVESLLLTAARIDEQIRIESPGAATNPAIKGALRNIQNEQLERLTELDSLFGIRGAGQAMLDAWKNTLKRNPEMSSIDWSSTAVTYLSDPTRSIELADVTGLGLGKDSPGFKALSKAFREAFGGKRIDTTAAAEETARPSTLESIANAYQDVLGYVKRKHHASILAHLGGSTKAADAAYSRIWHEEPPG